MIPTHVLASPLAALALPLASAPTGLPIHWDTPPACVDAVAVSERVAALTGTPMPAAALRLGAERQGEGWRISLVLEPSRTVEDPMHRTLKGRDCVTLGEAVALVVAVHLDAVATAGALAGEVGGERSVVPPVETTSSRDGAAGPEAGTAADPSRVPPVELAEPRDGSVTPRSEVEPPPGEPASRSSSSSRTSDTGSPRSRPRALMSLAAVGEVGVQPRGGAAFELAGGVGWSHARVELGALASVGPDGSSERLPEVGGRFRLLTGLLRGCGVPGGERVEVPLCGGFELGDLRATGTGLQRPATVDTPWIAVVASARPQWSPRLRSAPAPGNRRRTRLALGVLLDLVVPLLRPRFETPEAGTVHAVDPVAVRLGLRVELRLP